MSLLAACGDDDDSNADAAPSTAADTEGGSSSTATDDPESTTTSPDTAAPEPDPAGCTPERQGGDLTMAMFTFTTGLDPMTNSGGGVTGATELGAIYDTLMRWIPETGEFVPHLAESLEPNADFTEWTLTLRDGVTFGSGNPLDADAVIASIERLGPQSFRQGYIASFIADMRAPDDLTVVITLADPWGTFPYFLAQEGGMIVDAAVAEEMGDGFATNPVGAGAGPFEIVRFAPGEEIVMQGKDDYWGGPVCIDQLRFISIPGGPATYETFQQGEADVAFLRDSPSIALAEQDGVSIYKSVIGYSGALFINNRPGHPGEDLSVRQAVAAALDPDTIDERINAGAGLMSSAIVHPESLISPGIDGPAYDADAARQHVEEARAAGWDGTISLICPNNQAEASIVFEALLEAVGMDVTVELMPTVADLVQRVVVDANYDIACFGNGTEASSPYPALRSQLESTSAYTWTGYGDPRMDEALVSLREASNLEETRAAMAEVQAVWNETVPSAVYQSLTDSVIWDDDVHGLVFTRNNQVMFHGTYVEE